MPNATLLSPNVWPKRSADRQRDVRTDLEPVENARLELDHLHAKRLNTVSPRCGSRSHFSVSDSGARCNQKVQNVQCGTANEK